MPEHLITNEFKSKRYPRDYRLYKTGRRRWEWMDLTFQVFEKDKKYRLICFETGSIISLPNKFDHEGVVGDYCRKIAESFRPLRTSLAEADFTPKFLSPIEFAKFIGSQSKRFRFKYRFGCFVLNGDSDEKGFFVKLDSDAGIVYDEFHVNPFLTSSVRKWVDILRLIQLDQLRRTTHNGKFSCGKLILNETMLISGTFIDVINYVSEVKPHKLLKTWVYLEENNPHKTKLL